MNDNVIGCLICNDEVINKFYSRKRINEALKKFQKQDWFKDVLAKQSAGFYAIIERYAPEYISKIESNHKKFVEGYIEGTVNYIQQITLYEAIENYLLFGNDIELRVKENLSSQTYIFRTILKEQEYLVGTNQLKVFIEIYCI